MAAWFNKTYPSENREKREQERKKYKNTLCPLPLFSFKNTLIINSI